MTGTLLVQHMRPVPGTDYRLGRQHCYEHLNSHVHTRSGQADLRNTVAVDQIDDQLPFASRSSTRLMSVCRPVTCDRPCCCVNSTAGESVNDTLLMSNTEHTHTLSVLQVDHRFVQVDSSVPVRVGGRTVTAVPTVSMCWKYSPPSLMDCQAHANTCRIRETRL